MVASEDSRLPTVLILGGTSTLARPLALYLLSTTPLASFVKIADRFSVNPASTYLDKPFRALLADESGSLEYQQINLSNTARHTELFTSKSSSTAEESEGFDVVYDLTGEMGFDKPEIVSRTPSSLISDSNIQYPLPCAIISNFSVPAPSSPQTQSVHPLDPFFLRHEISPTFISGSHRVS